MKTLRHSIGFFGHPVFTARVGGRFKEDFANASFCLAQTLEIFSEYEDVLSCVLLNKFKLYI